MATALRGHHCDRHDRQKITLFESQHIMPTNWFQTTRRWHAHSWPRKTVAMAPGSSRVQHGTMWNDFRKEYFALRLLQAVEDGTVPRALFDQYLRESIEQGRRINLSLQ